MLGLDVSNNFSDQHRRSNVNDVPELYLTKATTCPPMRGRSSCESHYLLSPKSLFPSASACLRIRSQYLPEVASFRPPSILLQAPLYCEPQTACFEDIVDISPKPFLLSSNRDFEGASQSIFLPPIDDTPLNMDLTHEIPRYPR